MGDVNGDGWFFKAGLNGDSVLAKNYGNNNKQFFNGIEENPVTNKFVLCGANDFDGRDSTHAYVLLIDENGLFNADNQFSYHNMIDAQFYNVKYLKQSRYVLIRKQFNSSSGRKLEPMIMINNPIWDIPGGVTTYGSLEDDDLFQVAKTRDKGFICVGLTKGFFANLSDVFLVKVDSNYDSIGGAPSLVAVNEVSSYRNNSIKVYPTVVSAFVNIERDAMDNINTIIITNCMGERQSSFTNINSKQILDLSYLTNGIYLLNYNSEAYKKSFKIIISK